MTSEIKFPPVRTEFLDKPVEVPCPDCKQLMWTNRIWRSYTSDWQPTDDVESLDKCDSCYAAWQTKHAAYEADIARQEAEAEVRRRAIYERSIASRPKEDQIKLDFEFD